MRYSILGFNQARVMALTAIIQCKDKNNKEKDMVLSLDVNDLLILSLLADFPNRIGVKKIMKDDKVFFWASYDEILKELPILDIKKQALANRFDKLEKLHIIEREYLTINTKNNLTFFSLTETYESLLYDTNDPIVSEYERVSYSNTRGYRTQIRDNNNNIYDNNTDDIEESIKRKDEKNQNTYEKRQQAFYESLVPYVGKYPKEMIRAFYDYWSEPNPSKTKMRFELQKTWEVSRRLATWANNNLKFKNTQNTNYGRETVTDKMQRTISEAEEFDRQLTAQREASMGNGDSKPVW